MCSSAVFLWTFQRSCCGFRNKKSSSHLQANFTRKFILTFTQYEILISLSVYVDVSALGLSSHSGGKQSSLWSVVELLTSNMALSSLSPQIFPQVFPQVQPELFEECRKPKRHEEVPGTNRKIFFTLVIHSSFSFVEASLYTSLSFFSHSRPSLCLLWT